MNRIDARSAASRPSPRPVPVLAAADDPARIPPRPHASGDDRTGWEAVPSLPHSGSLDTESARWLELYREYSAVRPNVSALVLVAEVEDEMAGAA